MNIESAEIIPFGGKEKESHMDDILDEIRSGEHQASYIVVNDQGQIRYGHTAKTKADLIVLAHTMKRLMEYFIEANDYNGLIYEEDEDDSE